MMENLQHKEFGLPANSDKPLQVLSTGTKYVQGSVRKRYICWWIESTFSRRAWKTKLAVLKQLPWSMCHKKRHVTNI